MPSRSPFFHVAYIPICCLHSRWLILLTISCMQQLLDLWSCGNGLLKHVACLPTSNIFNIWFEYVRIPPIERLCPRIGYLSVFFNGYSVFISIFPAFSQHFPFSHRFSISFQHCYSGIFDQVEPFQPAEWMGTRRGFLHGKSFNI
jgi:hypothetical protein